MVWTDCWSNQDQQWWSQQAGSWLAHFCCSQPYYSTDWPESSRRQSFATLAVSAVPYVYRTDQSDSQSCRSVARKTTYVSEEINLAVSGWNCRSIAMIAMSCRSCITRTDQSGCNNARALLHDQCPVVSTIKQYCIESVHVVAGPYRIQPLSSLYALRACVYVFRSEVLAWVMALHRDHILATDLHEQPEATLPITMCDWFWLTIHLHLSL